MPDARHCLHMKKILQLLSQTAVAKQIGVHRRTIRNWCRQGHFPKPLISKAKRKYWSSAQVAEFLAGKFSPTEEGVINV